MASAAGRDCGVGFAAGAVVHRALPVAESFGIFRAGRAGPGDFLHLAQPAGARASRGWTFSGVRTIPARAWRRWSARAGTARFSPRSWNVSASSPCAAPAAGAAAQALIELTTWAERGYDLAITPDGPRGPCYQIQDGVTSLAQLTGLPIVPVSFNLNWKIRVKSWDRFQIPLPFARCEIAVGQGFPRAAKRQRCRARGIAQATRSGTARHYAGLTM